MRSIALPAIMRALSGRAATNRYLVTFLVINGIALLVLFSDVARGTPFFIWTPAAWLFWYASAVPRSVVRPQQRTNAIAEI